MQVRVFESDNMDSALRQIKEAFGPDALILSSRTVRKGGLGLFGKPIIEVTAAIDPNSENTAATAEHNIITASAPSQPNLSVTSRLKNGTNDDDVSYQEIWQQEQPVSADPLPNPYDRGAGHPDTSRYANYVRPVSTDNARRQENKHLQAIQLEVGELRELIHNLVKDLPQQMEKVAQSKVQPFFYPPPRADHAQGIPSNQPLLDALSKLGIEAEVAQTIANYALSQLTGKQISDPVARKAFLGKIIAELVQTTGDILPELGKSKRLALIGPTGVGKTTTIAKLAAAYLLAGGKRVALITIDTYRIAAVEQLKVYGEIMNLPVEVVKTPEQLRAVLQRHSNKDLILIDTAGRSPKDDVSLNELQDFLAVDGAIEPHLVLSATTRERDLYETYNRFSALGPKSLLMTKLDECESLGVLLNIYLIINCPLSYLTNGQKVPEDLVQANAELVSALILENSEG
jgi:flagellar biosynthesis protein FlhF